MNKSLTNLMMSVGLVGSLVLAADSVNAEDRAKADFVNYCASCHGVDGTGNGPMADVLKAKPSDLTTLTKNNGKDFPYLKLRKVIDGTVETGKMRVHSSKEMPVWGDVFRRKAVGDNKYVAAQARIMSIIDYITSIQK